MIQIEEMKIYILNTTRFYHEDFEEYPGAWFSCPVNFEEIRERLGVQSEEEIEIEDYELPFPLEGNTRLWEINALCRMVQKVQLFGEVTEELFFHSLIFHNTINNAFHNYKVGICQLIYFFFKLPTSAAFYHVISR